MLNHHSVLIRLVANLFCHHGRLTIQFPQTLLYQARAHTLLANLVPRNRVLHKQTRRLSGEAQAAFWNCQKQ